MRTPVDVKICGLSTQDSLDAALQFGASHVGFVFFTRSPRNVAFDRLAGLASTVPAAIKKVGVFVDPDAGLLEQAIALGGLDIVQLHGAESPAQVLAVKQRYNVGVWKALGVQTSADVAAACVFAGVADLILLDAKAPPDIQVPGGNGLRFDWRILDGQDWLYRMGHWGLSGGLSAQTVAAAIAATRPALVDVSSGVEDAPGIKNTAKIKAFLQAATGGVSSQ